MHWHAVAVFTIAALLAGVPLWMATLIIWPHDGIKRGWQGWTGLPCLIAVALWILAVGGGGLWWAGLLTAPFLLGAAMLISPPGKHHRSGSEERTAPGEVQVPGAAPEQPRQLKEAA